MGGQHGITFNMIVLFGHKCVDVDAYEGTRRYVIKQGHKEICADVEVQKGGRRLVWVGMKGYGWTWRNIVEYGWIRGCYMGYGWILRDIA